MDASALNLTRTWFDEHLRRALEHARKTGHREWFAKSLAIPAVPLVQAFVRYQGFAWLFTGPDGSAQLGLGSVRDWQWRDSSSLDRMAQYTRQLVVEGLPPRTLVVGGMAFSAESLWSDWPGVYLALPLAQVVQTRHEATLQVTMAIDGEKPLEYYHRQLHAVWETLADSPNAFVPQSLTPERIVANPARSQWLKQVEQATQAIRAGRLEKVVLARALTVEYAQAARVDSILANLCAQNPDATVFAMRHSGSVFLGASPELLARVRDDTVESMSLAGSAPRGLTPEEDFDCALRMQRDPKSAREHGVVRRHVQEALSDLTVSLKMPEVPNLKKLPSVQHLLTPVFARLKPDASLWSVVQKLHPTPAVAGYPIEASTQYIVNVAEPFARGWYAGSLGWTELSGDGQWIVALRSGIIRGNNVVLYAGCGIMEDSDPATELAESDWKFNTMLSALEIEGESY
ncbi:MAG: isochorismate synthase [Sulfobacillus acidophilus]|uniref:isochorismate synthase n=1 Tax=Sulfobacillus acidophilus TaxID=53633 RepID=A0A2T2WIZ3_9FIRM|nr:MAG: isochorismate synthase [Sulfobacillus acidophilus]